MPRSTRDAMRRHQEIHSADYVPRPRSRRVRFEDNPWYPAYRRLVELGRRAEGGRVAAAESPIGGGESGGLVGRAVERQGERERREEVEVIEVDDEGWRVIGVFSGADGRRTTANGSFTSTSIAADTSFHPSTNDNPPATNPSSSTAFEEDTAIDNLLHTASPLEDLTTMSDTGSKDSNVSGGTTPLATTTSDRVDTPAAAAPAVTFTEKEERVLKMAWMCLKSGPPDIDMKKLTEVAGFNTVKTTSNTWGAIKKKLLAMSPTTTFHTGTEGEDGGAATPKSKATPKKRAAPTPKKLTEDREGEESPAKKTRTPAKSAKSKAVVKEDAQDSEAEE